MAMFTMEGIPTKALEKAIKDYLESNKKAYIDKAVEEYRESVEFALASAVVQLEHYLSPDYDGHKTGLMIKLVEASKK
jgi:hypothetical protein